MRRTLAIASDHAGYLMKLDLIKHLKEKGYLVHDLGTDSTEPVNYPDFGHPLAEIVESGEIEIGISLCGSGNGINMVTNKHQGIRGALCWSREISEMARYHNNANICSLPARYIDLPTAIEIVDAFLETAYEGRRHDIRISKIPIQK
ncbi:MAG: RpiB/LacA/LacB family sugar-phosphate isomerase [Bacteroidota bacterium]|nr:RpiB/LacA/LacB family sugar-phosphate isomerase [Bacteroidota bacterium]